MLLIFNGFTVCRTMSLFQCLFELTFFSCSCFPFLLKRKWRSRVWVTSQPRTVWGGSAFLVHCLLAWFPRIPECEASRCDAVQCRGDKNTKNTVLCTWIRLWMHWSGCGAVLQSDAAHYVDLVFIRCIEEHRYMAKLFSMISHVKQTGTWKLILWQCYAPLVDEGSSFG